MDDTKPRTSMITVALKNGVIETNFHIRCDPIPEPNCQMLRPWASSWQVAAHEQVAGAPKLFADIPEDVNCYRIAFDD